ncbi:DapH/DapD/GlmU-related protein [Epilithonimonas sp.]|uniref:DapH/DapD/GlmU-related protein n=1 Tax=Epilithonimonas sp. TaxID=2894511 RepID=UPI00289ABC1E|nr:DapH/DapD/GlmU-related protein [Epilithonimonas sp.]
MIFKLFWIVRALLFKPFFGRFGFVSYIGKPIFIKGSKKIFIGKNVRIFPHLRIEAYENAKIVIEDNVGIGQNVHITSASNLIIGSNTTILANTFITNIDHEYKEIGKHILDQPMIVKETRIGENCFIGIGVAIQAGTILGKQCIVGSNSVVRGSFPDYSVIAGSPAKIIKKYNFKTQNWEKI